jgi:hypothetical protein
VPVFPLVSCCSAAGFCPPTSPTRSLEEVRPHRERSVVRVRPRANGQQPVVPCRPLTTRFDHKRIGGGRAGYASADIRLERPVSEDGVHPSVGWPARGVEDVLHADMIAHLHGIGAAIRLTLPQACPLMPLSEGCPQVLTADIEQELVPPHIFVTRGDQETGTGRKGQVRSDLRKPLHKMARVRRNVRSCCRWCWRRVRWQYRRVADEWQLTRDSLAAAGVDGAEDLGYFVNNLRYFQPSKLDERAAMPVLLKLLPTLTEPTLVGAVAAHLRRPWARRIAFGPLVDAFRRWATLSEDAGWQLGDALASAAQLDDLPVLLRLVSDTRYGTARQMIVDSLWRFRKSPLVEPALVSLITDPAVALHAMSALRRSIGPASALPYLRQVAAGHSGDRLGKTAASQIRRAEASARHQRSPQA